MGRRINRMVWTTRETFNLIDLLHEKPELESEVLARIALKRKAIRGEWSFESVVSQIEKLRKGDPALRRGIAIVTSTTLERLRALLRGHGKRELEFRDVCSRFPGVKMEVILRIAKEEGCKFKRETKHEK